MNALQKLSALDSDAAGKMARAVGRAKSGVLAADERQWVTRIEALRNELAASSAQITLTDYGSGAAHLARTQQEMHQGVSKTVALSQLARVSSKSAPWTQLLFHLIREFKPAVAIELGACCGISAAYQAGAQKLNGRGRLITLEGAAPLAALARENLAKLGLDNAELVEGRFQDTLEGVLKAAAPVEYVFIDGHHDRDATRRYFETCIPYLAKQAVVVFDDIAWSAGMREAWKGISKDSRVKLAIETEIMGICVLDGDIAGRAQFRLRLRGYEIKAMLRNFWGK